MTTLSIGGPVAFCARPRSPGEGAWPIISSMTPTTRLAVQTMCTAVVASSLAAAPSATAAAPKPVNGHYVGTETPEAANGLDDIVFNFDVVKGRRIVNFTMAMNVICSGFPLYTEYVVQPMNPMTVNKRTGRFRDVVKGQSDSGLDYRVVVTGRLKGTRVTQGTMFYQVGVCVRGDKQDPITWKARRTGR